MASFVLDHFTVPPGGCFYYVEPKTGARIEGGDYAAWTDAIEKHRKANGIELEPMWKLHIEEWLCYDLASKGKDWCRINGAGDMIAYGLRPLAHLSDQYLGTKLASCGGCAQRQQSMNKW